MQKYLILVEGKADAPFVRDYLKFLDKNLSIEQNEPKEKVLKNTESSIKIEVIGGYTKIEKHSQKLTRYIDQGYKILVIQNADNSHKNHRGNKERTKYLENIKKELEIDFEIFLFPNNKSEGDLETLLLEIANQEKYNPAFECYKKYAACAKEIEADFSEELVQNKMRIFNYFRTYFGMEQAKEENRTFKPEYWELSSDKLKSFKIISSKRLKKYNTFRFRDFRRNGKR